MQGWNVPPRDDRYVVIQVLLPIISLDKQLFNCPKDEGHLDTSASTEAKEPENCIRKVTVNPFLMSSHGCPLVKPGELLLLKQGSTGQV